SWESALADTRLHIAVNQEIVKTDAAIVDGDEIAWFPPVTGG
ncbi:MAG: MoaD/ThiS family protein, partial [Gammaproteobacteria bacterium]|nr:MoaD/ThiS family protein [Gammaproteobacteria bacterium]